MMCLRSIIIAVATTVLLSTPAVAKDDYVYGPEPDWSRANALGEAALRTQLPDPDNWTVSWPWGYMQMDWSHKGRTPGWLTCGIMNAKVPVPGRQASVMFVAVIDYDQVRRIDISQKMRNSLINIACDDFVTRGMLPPASLRPAPAELEIANLGMTIRIMPEGAYVLRISEGSIADHAGLTAGTVVTSVNGIALAGLGTAMANILGSDTETLRVQTAAGSEIKLRQAQ
jgi:hypothetical protein